jgi:hypothetical protein
MSQTIMSLGYQSTIADPDVYQQAATKANGKKEYYEFVLVCG